MTLIRWSARGAVAVLLTAGALHAAPGTSLAAQEPRDRDACRCVDREGNEIENCSCLRSFGRTDGDFFARLMPVRSRARLGVTVSAEQPAEYDGQGARVTDLLDGGPAHDAGLRSGDIITSVDGRSLFDPLDADTEADFDLDRSVPVQRLLAIAEELEPGREVEVEYLRGGEARRATVTTEDLGTPGRLQWTGRGGVERLGDRLRELGARAPVWGLGERWGPGEGWAPAGDGHFAVCPESGSDGRARPFVAHFDDCVGGLQLVGVTPGLAEYFGTDGGVLVADVHPESPVALQAGDVILRIGERAAESPERVRRILRSYAPDEQVTFHIVRRNREMSVQGRLTR